MSGNPRALLSIEGLTVELPAERRPAAMRSRT